MAKQVVVVGLGRFGSGVARLLEYVDRLGSRLAHSLFNPDVQEYLELTPAFGISRIRVPDRFTSMTLRESGFAGVRDKYGVAVLALKRADDITLSPDGDERLQEGDVLVVAGRDEQVDKISG